jgi:cyanophycinase
MEVVMSLVHRARASLRGVLLLVCFCLIAPVMAQVTNESENNDRESLADGPVGSGVRVSGGLSSSGDIDWFYFDLAAAATLTISLNHDAGDDFDWALYRSSGGAISSGKTTNIPEAGSYGATAAGRYYLKLTAYRGSGWYTLDLNIASGGGGVGTRPTKPGNLQNWLTGNAADSGRNPVNGPAMLLMGGGAEVDSAFSQRAFPVANGGDVVVLRTTGSNGYNDYLFNLVTGTLKPDSVETLLLDTRDKANSDYADWVIRNAELIFIAGGDQADYLNQWKDTRTEDAIRAAYNRGAVIGGLSAGLAVQGEFIYDPDGVSGVTSTEALANPYRSNMILSNGFLDLPLMNDIVTDTHFAQRDRMGRLFAFMARLRQDNASARIIGLAIDENTSLFIDRNGRGTADGGNAVYVVEERSDTQRTQVISGSPLIYRNLQRTKLVAGQTFDFATYTHTGTAIVLSVDGRNATAPFTPTTPY